MIQFTKTQNKHIRAKIKISPANLEYFGTHIYKENYMMAIDLFESYFMASCCYKNDAQTNLRAKPK